MASATQHENFSANYVTELANPGELNEVLDQVFAELPTRVEPVASSPLKILRPVASGRKLGTTRGVQAGYQPRPRNRMPADSGRNFDWFTYLARTICLGSMLVGAVLFYRSMPSDWQASVNPFSDSPQTAAGAAPVSHSPGGERLLTKPIGEARVGDRVLGRNPIREQADLVDPDPATWRHISLRIKKKSGLSLWIELLRPLSWIEERNAKPGSTIFVDLAEMGAVGEAEVTYLGPCPEIRPGTGTVVTGTFKHEVDENTKVVYLRLEDQPEPTGVTDNHSYWSADRQDFVEVGQLRIGELVDTEYGLKRVTSVTPIEHNGFLYNLETTEHVYRVGSLGTLVHNNCLGNNMIKAGSYGDLGTDAHHIVANTHRTAKPARDVLKRHRIELDDPMNGVWLPRNSTDSRARGALHREAGSALTNTAYLDEVNRRILDADTRGGRPHVLRELQKIRFELLNGTFPGVRPNF